MSSTRRTLREEPPADAPARNTRSRATASIADPQATAASTAPINPMQNRSGRSSSTVEEPRSGNTSHLTSISHSPSSTRWADEDPELADELPDLNEFIESTSPRGSRDTSDNASFEDARGEEERTLSPHVPRSPGNPTSGAPSNESVPRDEQLSEVLSPGTREQRRHDKQRGPPEDASPRPSVTTLDSDVRAYIDGNFPRDAARLLRERIKDEIARRGKPLRSSEVEALIEEGLQDFLQGMSTKPNEAQRAEEDLEWLEHTRQQLGVLFRPRENAEDDEAYLRRLDLQRAREEEFLGPSGSSDTRRALEWAAVREFSRNSRNTREVLQRLRLSDIEENGTTAVVAVEAGGAGQGVSGRPEAHPSFFASSALNRRKSWFGSAMLVSSPSTGPPYLMRGCPSPGSRGCAKCKARSGSALPVKMVGPGRPEGHSPWCPMRVSTYWRYNADISSPRMPYTTLSHRTCSANGIMSLYSVDEMPEETRKRVTLEGLMAPSDWRFHLRRTRGAFSLRGSCKWRRYAMYPPPDMGDPGGGTRDMRMRASAKS
ncbi:hypothetical protein GGG16DRAFT_119415, partial [Schizophyllum commune]